MFFIINPDLEEKKKSFALDGEIQDWILHVSVEEKMDLFMIRKQTGQCMRLSGSRINTGGSVAPAVITSGVPQSSCLKGLVLRLALLGGGGSHGRSSDH
jgi:hypothetical protein